MFSLQVLIGRGLDLMQSLDSSFCSVLSVDFFFLWLTFTGVYYREAPPVPIPNTVVKLTCADDTWRVAAWENWSMPVQILDFSES